MTQGTVMATSEMTDGVKLRELLDRHRKNLRGAALVEYDAECDAVLAPFLRSPAAVTLQGILDLQPLAHKNDATRLWQMFATPEDAQVSVTAALTPSFCWVSEEMLDAACDAYQDRMTGPEDRQRDLIRAALTAAAPFLHSPASTVNKQYDYAGLVDALRHQSQCDEDGVLCIVSRQAADEAADIIEQTYVRSLLVAADDGKGAAVLWESEAKFMLQTIPAQYRRTVREGGGPENVRASLALSVAAMRDVLASPAPAPKVGDGFVSVPKFVCERGGAGWALWVENDNRRGNRPYIYSLGLSEFEEIHMKGIARALNRYFAELAAAPEPVVADSSPDWNLRVRPKADTAPERDPRNDPQVGDVCERAYSRQRWVVMQRAGPNVHCDYTDANRDDWNGKTVVQLWAWERNDDGEKFYTAEQWADHENATADHKRATTGEGP